MKLSLPARSSVLNATVQQVLDTGAFVQFFRTCRNYARCLSRGRLIVPELNPVGVPPHPPRPHPYGAREPPRRKAPSHRLPHCQARPDPGTAGGPIPRHPPLFLCIGPSPSPVSLRRGTNVMRAVPPPHLVGQATALHLPSVNRDVWVRSTPLRNREGQRACASTILPPRVPERPTVRCRHATRDGVTSPGPSLKGSAWRFLADPGGHADVLRAFGPVPSTSGELGLRPGPAPGFSLSRRCVEAALLWSASHEGRRGLVGRPIASTRKGRVTFGAPVPRRL